MLLLVTRARRSLCSPRHVLAAAPYPPPAGRFALGQMARTPFALFFDDDCIPGARYTAHLLHTVNIVGGGFDVLLGMKGHGNGIEDPSSHALLPYFLHWQYRAARLEAVDLTGEACGGGGGEGGLCALRCHRPLPPPVCAGGQWFVRTKHLRAMWRETPVPCNGGPWETGEDFQLSYG